jgi:hypothetical protein
VPVAEMRNSLSSGEARAGLAERIGEVDVVDVCTKREISSLVTYLLGERSQPVIALASIAPAGVAVLPPQGVRAVIGAGPRIYVIAQDMLLPGLAEKLGSALTLTAGAARIWWPCLTRDSDPRDHPLVSPSAVKRAGGLLEKFAWRFDLTRPRVREAIRGLEDARAVVERQLEDTQGQLAASAQRLHGEQAERERQQTRAESAEAQLRTFERSQMASRVEHLLHGLIFREWMTALTDAERREHPLNAYILTAEILEQVVTRQDLPPEGMAWACAMIASRYPPGLEGITQHPLLAAPDGPQAERPSDGAKGWRCSLNQDVRGGLRLHYWVRPDRTVEFTTIGGHDGFLVGRGHRRGGVA